MSANQTEDKTNFTGQDSNGANDCPECHGKGRVVIEMPMRQYMEMNGLPNIYGSEDDFMTGVSVKCPKCNGGFYIKVNQAKKVATIPESFYDKKLDSYNWSMFKNDKIRKAIVSFTEDFQTWQDKGMGLYIYSESKGTGKTFLASCICNELMEKKAIRTRFVNESALIDIQQSSDNSTTDYNRNPFLLLMECKLLVIDDVGAKNTGNEWLEDILYKILDNRMTRNLITIITSNRDISNLPYGIRIKDRINAMCLPVHLPENAMRNKEITQKREEILKSIDLL